MKPFGRVATFLSSALVAAAVVRGGAQAPEPPQKPALLTQYCITCHNQRLKTAGLLLDTMDVDHVGKDAAAWEKVVRKIRTGMMPPSGARRPDRTADGRRRSR